MIALLLLLAQDPLIARARSVLAAERGCQVSAHATDITVCGLRRADRYRVPFVGYDEGDPRAESVIDERVCLLNRTTPVEDMGPFQVEGGMAGISAGTAGVHGYEPRRLAP